MELISYLAV